VTDRGVNRDALPPLGHASFYLAVRRHLYKASSPRLASRSGFRGTDAATAPLKTLSSLLISRRPPRRRLITGGQAEPPAPPKGGRVRLHPFWWAPGPYGTPSQSRLGYECRVCSITYRAATTTERLPGTAACCPAFLCYTERAFPR
jgi:hypothetical protein